jgi:hypothetical protein
VLDGVRHELWLVDERHTEHPVCLLPGRIGETGYDRGDAEAPRRDEGGNGVALSEGVVATKASADSMPALRITATS